MSSCPQWKGNGKCNKRGLNEIHLFEGRRSVRGVTLKTSHTTDPLVSSSLTCKKTGKLTVGWAFTQTYCTRGMNNDWMANNQNIQYIYIKKKCHWGFRQVGWETEKEIWVNSITRESQGCTSARNSHVSALGFTAVISENGLISRLFAYFLRKITHPGIH